MELIADLQTSARHAQGVLFSCDGAELITVGQDPAVKVWTVPGFELARSLDGHDKSVNCAALTEDCGTLVTGSTDRTVRVWDFRKGTLLRTHKGHTNTVAGIRISPDGRWAASASYDGSVRLWPLQGDEDVKVLKGHKRNVVSVEFVDGGATLASAGVGGDILLWDVESGETVGALEGHGTAAGSLQLDPDGERLWSLGYDGRILVHTLGDRAVEREIEVAEERPFMMCLSSDGSRLGMTYSGGAAVYSAEPYERICAASTKVKGMYGVAFSPDGSLLAAASADGKTRVWRVDA